MKKGILLLLLTLPSLLSAQLFNREIRINSGIGRPAIAFNNQFESLNDTSYYNFDFVSKSPTLGISYNHILSDVFSVSARLGGQYLNIYHNNQHYGSSYISFSLSPELVVINRLKFDYYLKLSVGVNYWFNHPDLLEMQLRRLFPEKANVFVGFTLVGVHYMITPKFGLNAEVNLWSPELINFGITYRYLHGEIPTNPEMRNF
jgi:hypothetical protein